MIGAEQITAIASTLIATLAALGFQQMCSMHRHFRDMLQQHDRRLLKIETTLRLMNHEAYSKAERILNGEE